jgi:hypothetical protein
MFLALHKKLEAYKQTEHTLFITNIKLEHVAYPAMAKVTMAFCSFESATFIPSGGDGCASTSTFSLWSLCAIVHQQPKNQIILRMFRCELCAFSFLYMHFSRQN